MRTQQQVVNEYKPVNFRPDKRENNVEYLFDQAVCTPCSLFGLCSHGGGSEQLSIQSRPLHKGDYLFRQGDKLQNIYVIRSGGVKLLYTGQDGTEQILNFYLRGEILGLGDVEAGIHSCSAIALETTSICKLPYDRLKSVCQSEPRLYDQLFRMASREIAYEQTKMVLLGQKQSEERFATFIIDLATRNKRNGYSHREFNLTMSRHDIANYLCLADETISRLITKFCTDRLLDVNKRSIRICDHGKLSEKAGMASPGRLAYAN
jgi:CRP/FNR family transcriptional regulator